MDPIDKAQEREQQQRDDAIRDAGKQLDPGIPGECEFCGEHKPRVVETPKGMACGRCRDEFRLP